MNAPFREESAAMLQNDSMLASSNGLDFGYPWWLSYGHLPIVAGALLFMLLGYALKWSRWLTIAFGVLLLWSSSAFLVLRFGLNANGRAASPTQSFLRSGRGR